ncbi:MAG: GNAT family N-acetyltransferase [Bacilli bacterium]|nr:GNAT family N-acetyltransferase [Bacilli bacterium]
MYTAREFQKQDETEIIKLKKEIEEKDGIFDGIMVFKKNLTIDQLLNKLETLKNIKEKNYSNQISYGFFQENKLIGIFSIRPELKGSLQGHGGNIGYFIRPKERGKGYGNLILKEALKKAKEFGLEKVLITCHEKNIASAKVIEANGGEYDTDYYDSVIDETFHRFWITIKEDMI